MGRAVFTAWSWWSGARDLSSIIGERYLATRVVLVVHATEMQSSHVVSKVDWH